MYMKLGMVSPLPALKSSVQCFSVYCGSSPRPWQLPKYKFACEPPGVGPPGVVPVMNWRARQVSKYWMSPAFHSTRPLGDDQWALYADMSPDSRAVCSP